MNLCITEREMLASSRKKELYWSRFLIGFVIFLGFAYLTYLENQEPTYFENGVSHQELSQILQATFASVMYCQLMLVLVATPGLFAGTFPDERKRKTLHYLLQTPLSGVEIVLGKLLAGMARVASALLVVFPIVMMFTLLGGIDPLLVLLGYAGILSTAVLVGSFTLLISVGSKRTGIVYLLIYVLGYLWITGTFVLRVMPGSPRGFEAIWPWVRWANDFVYPTSPFSILSNQLFRGSLRSLPFDVLKMVLYQMGYATVFVLLAGVRVRPAFRKIEEEGVGGWLRRLFRMGRAKKKPARGAVRGQPAVGGSRGLRIPFWPRRPECGNQPVRWREMFVVRVRGKARLLILLVSAGFAYGIGRELWHEINFNPQWLHEYIRGTSMPLVVVWLGAITCLAAGSVASECDSDTWISLVSTPLSPREILFGKMLGAVWRAKWLVVAMVALWTLDLATGGLPWQAYVLALVELGVFAWFGCALGVFLSLTVGLGPRIRARGSSQATSAAILCLILHAVLPLILIGPILYVLELRQTPFLFVGIQPMVLLGTLVSFNELESFIGQGKLTRTDVFDFTYIPRLEYVLALVFSLVMHALEAWLFTVVSLRSFNRLVGRPRRVDRKPLPKSVLTAEV